MNRFNSRADIEKRQHEIEAARASTIQIAVAGGTCGCAAGADKIRDALASEIAVRGLAGKVSLRVTGCHGFCSMEAMVLISREGGLNPLMYCQVTPGDAAEIIEKTVAGEAIIERLVYTHPDTGEKIPWRNQIPFFKLQTRRLLDWGDRIDPLKIDEYIGQGGYRALGKALSMTAEAVIEDIRTADLRGRGGAGFPTAMKWKLARAAIVAAIAKAEEPVRSYVICNADEGDPGAYMDRSLLEGNPHSVIEGMIIGAHAVAGGLACKVGGFVYARAEYPMAIRHLQHALDQARSHGLLGENILGTGMTFDIEIVKGAGAFVCGEETALLESIEDRPGEPRPKPPYPVNNGLWNWPTVLNNTKTWASCRYILDHGPADFASVGTEGNRGTMVFALVGKVRNSGLIEVPMGIRLRTIVEDIGHGVAAGATPKAVQTGGPSGGCLPAEKFDMPVDYASLNAAGTIMGSGGMIVMDDHTCMVDTARYFLKFAMNESCGKCTPCREGVRHLYDILTDITEGRGKPEHLGILEKTGRLICQLSFCGLGKTAPNPVLSTLRYFREEYEAHLQGRCPARVCTALVTYRILEPECTGCTACARKCPVGCISGERKKLHAIDASRCIKCGICMQTCKFNAIEVK